MPTTLRGYSALDQYYNRSYLAEHREYLTDRRADREVATLVRWLGREPRNVCDVGCGDGRHLAAFLRRGVPAGFGFDRATRLVRLARERLAGHRGFIAQVMDFNRWRPAAPRFDLTCCLFSAFSYNSANTAAQRLMGRMAAATERGGLICLDVDNVFRLQRYLDDGRRAKRHRSSGSVRFDAARMVLWARERCGRQWLETETRYFMATELARFALDAGLRPAGFRFIGDWDGQPYISASSRLIFLARK